MNKWDKRFLQLAILVSSWSKDPSTQVGAIAVNKKRRIVSTGYNGFPVGVPDDGRLHDREIKYELIIHAEMNVILNAVDSLEDTTLYTYPIPPCLRCATMVIQSGVTRIVTVSLDDDLVPRWKEQRDKAKDLYITSGAIYDEFHPADVLVDSA